MAWSKLDIINFAFNILNKSSVSDLENSGEFAVVAKTNFDMLYEAEISGFSWRFATKLQELVDTGETPLINQWRYIYYIPNDFLAAVRVYPNSDFQIYNNERLYSNINDLIMEYRYLPDITHLPAYFVQYFSVLLAERFALAVADDSALASKLAQKVVDARGQALFNDSQNHPTPNMFNNPVIRARFSGIYPYYDYPGVW